MECGTKDNQRPHNIPPHTHPENCKKWIKEIVQSQCWKYGSSGIVRYTEDEVSHVEVESVGHHVTKVSYQREPP